jgi:hypothetical protein
MTATLRFLSYVRRGLARSLGEPADANGIPRSGTATVDVTVLAAGAQTTRTVTVRGPGAVVALAPDEVLRVDPPDGSGDAVASRFPSAELRTADLPWVFTPARPARERLIPWLVLTVVEEREGVTFADGVLTVDDAARELPDLGEAWAWAHAQVWAGTDDLAVLLADTPELATARLLCPRLLEPSRHYLACIVPSFEAGRQAGLGLPVDADAAALAWAPDGRDIRLPVLHAWRFATGADPADFEELVRRLQPRPLGADVGVHDLDLSDPGTTRLPNDPVVTGYVGPLASGTVRPPPWRDPERAAFEQAMATLLADAVPGQPWRSGTPYDAAKHDPVVGPPRYGALPAGVDRVPAPDESPSPTAPRWLSQANLDPHFRAAAGLGAEVVRRDQEALMAQAWDQVRGLGQVNRLLARTRLARETGRRTQAKLARMSDGTLLQVTAGAHGRLRGGVAGRTVLGRRADSAVPTAVFSGAFRRQTRAGSLVARAVTEVGRGAMTGRVTESWARAPATMVTYATLTVPFGADASPVVVDVDPGTGATPPPVGGRARSAPVGSPALPAPRPVDSVFGKRDHAVSALGAAVALGDGPDLGVLAGIVAEQLEPTAVLTGRLRQLVAPAGALGGEPVPASVRVGLELTDPLYRRLVAIDPELLLPGIGALPADTIGLAAVSQPSVEAFLLGANNQLAQELRWREFPVEVGGTWLRTFWDSVDGARDIPPIAAWAPGPLGTHAGARRDPGQLLVLIVKGDLLRRYPDTLVTAVPARWANGVREEDPDGDAVDPSLTGTLRRDATFLGFDFGPDVDVQRDVAGSPDPNARRPGWYFAFEQPPTQPAFGLDDEASDTSPGLALWKDLTSGDARTSARDTHVNLAALGHRRLPYDDQGENTWTERWADSAAGMARITLQRPVRMLVHADQMLSG